MTWFHSLFHLSFCFLLSYLLSLRNHHFPVRFSLPSLFYFFTIFLSAVLIFILLLRSYFPTDGVVLTSVSSDLSEEIAFIHSFLIGINHHHFSLLHPFSVNHTLSTHWFSAFHSASLITGFASLRSSLLWPSFLLILSSLALLYHFALNFSGSDIVASLSVFLFLFVGGCGFVFYFQVGPRDFAEVDFIQTFDKDYKIEWGSSILHYLLPMRYSQWTFSLIVGGIVLLNEMILKSKIKEISVFAGLLFGFVPICDARLIIPIVIFVFGFFSLKHSFSHCLRFVISCSSIVIFQIPSIFEYFRNWNGFAFIEMWYPLYLRGIFFTSIAMWFENLGCFIFFAIVVCWFWLKKNQIKFYLPAISVFILCNFCRFQTESRLNFIVLFPLWMVPAVVVVASMFREMVLSSKDRQIQGAVCGYCVLFVILCTFSGMLGIRKQYSETKMLWNSSEREVAKWIVGNTRENARFTGNCSKNLVVAMLTGRAVSCVPNLEHFGLPNYKREIEISREIEYSIGEQPPGWSLVYSVGDMMIYQRS
jgi:hypothetical protein